MTTENEDEMLIDTSKMNEGQRQALEVAEQSRETEWKHPSFGKELFSGNFAFNMIENFPSQSPEEKEIGDEFLKELVPVLQQLNAEAVDETRTIPDDIVNQLKDMGVFALKAPKEYEGLGLSQVNYNRIMTAIASHCGSTAVLVSAHQSIGVPQPLKMFGTEEQKKKWFPEFRKGAISAFALTEPEVGSDPAKMTTMAEPVEDGKFYEITGEKLWCTNGPIADVLVVMARTPDKIVKGKPRQQITAFIVTKDMPGFEVVHRCDFMGIRGINNGLLRFNKVRVPAENIILGEGKGLKLALSTLNTGRLTLPAACTGAAKQCLVMARNWGNERVQWGAPIGYHEEGSAKIADIAATTFAMEAVTNLTSHWADDKNKDIRLEAAMAKLFCSTAAWRVVDETVQLRGGRGYEKASSLKARGEKAWPIERMLRDMRINRIIEGTDEIMRLFIAREAMDFHLSKAGKILHPKTPLLEKASTAVKAGLFYSKWYTNQWINGSVLRRYGKYGKLAKNMRYLDKASKKLSKALFHAIALNGPKLEKKQMLLGRLMEVGTELFAMSATCSYAHSMKHTAHYEQAVQLANAFCEQSHLRIDNLFKAVSSNADKTNNKLAKTVLEDNVMWLEEGVVPLPLAGGE